MRKTIFILPLVALAGCGEYADRIPAPPGTPANVRQVLIADEDGGADADQVAHACVDAKLPGFVPTNVTWFAHDAEDDEVIGVVTCVKR